MAGGGLLGKKLFFKKIFFIYFFAGFVGTFRATKWCERVRGGWRRERERERVLGLFSPAFVSAIKGQERQRE